MIEPLVDWLSNHFYYGWEQADKKQILKILMYIFMGLRAISPNSTVPDNVHIADIFLPKRCKAQW